MTAEIKNGLGRGKNETNIRISVLQGSAEWAKRSAPGIASNFAARLYYNPAAGRRSRGTLDCSACAAHDSGGHVLTILWHWKTQTSSPAACFRQGSACG